MAGYEYWDACGDGITGDDARAAYDDMLDDVHGDFMGIPASTVLAECDPIAYRVGFYDFADMMVTDGEWFEQCGDDGDDDTEQGQRNGAGTNGAGSVRRWRVDD